MKKSYVTPTAEKIAFQYQEQVAASGNVCKDQTINEAPEGYPCENWSIVKNYLG